MAAGSSGVRFEATCARPVTQVGERGECWSGAHQGEPGERRGAHAVESDCLLVTEVDYACVERSHPPAHGLAGSQAVKVERRPQCFVARENVSIF